MLCRYFVACFKEAIRSASFFRPLPPESHLVPKDEVLGIAQLHRQGVVFPSNVKNLHRRRIFEAGEASGLMPKHRSSEHSSTQ
jgi:hypothetical protein